MYEASVYVFTYESTRENYYDKHTWNIALWQSTNRKGKQKVRQLLRIKKYMH